MTGTFYKFAKKTNSTALPSGGALVPIELKEESSVLNPTILIKQNAFPDYNYCYLSEFNRYYWINEIVWQNGIWRMECSVDVLGSYKEQIGAQSYYFGRSSAKYNGDIIDRLYPSKTSYTYYNDDINGLSFGWQSLSSGYYVVGLVGKFSFMQPQAGAITYIVLQDTQLKELMKQLFANDLNWYLQPGETDIGISQTLGKMIFDPFQYIKTVRWIPVKPPVSGNVNSIEIGWWEYSPEGGIEYLNNNPCIEKTTGLIELRKHPKSIDRGKFLNCSRFTNYKMFVPSIGLIDLDANQLLEFNYLSCSMNLDPIEGKTRIDIYGTTNQIGADLFLLKREYGNFGVDINLAQASVKFSDVLRTGANNMGSIATATPSAIVDTIADFADLFRPQVNSTGENSGFLNIMENQNAKLQSIFYDIVDEDNNQLGRPLCEIGSCMNIGNGYYEVIKPDSVIAGTHEELNMINSFLEGGFFYE